MRRCRYVYLDLGSNKGVQIRKLYEPWLYPNGKILPFYDKIFGKIRHYSRRDVCTFGFEANPRHMKRLKYIEKRYRSYNINVTFFNNAVSNISSESVTIYSDTNFDIDWGSGIQSSLIDNKANMTMYTVQTIDIVQFFAENIVPLKPDYVFAKMDIEGSEFIVLPHMLKGGLLCDHAISSMVLEMHDSVREEFHSDLSFATLKERLKDQACTPTTIHNLDDETYTRDVPFEPCEEESNTYFTY
ncbi:uncharacterized protein LOC127839841 [Dreissena polymorpha]|uniref:Methyltransferase FkbM domain-containing protein n=1 Tax=Dreissena polymorpha TaxID=45954 RepID=A0A9D4FHX4_DREPO|nr:uncharacterized protein LOC127839841 [Dreissena polymorpha]KAH3799449.1 hypothetical protein DPMN_153057 [Dreissena polymorpha]